MNNGKWLSESDVINTVELFYMYWVIVKKLIADNLNVIWVSRLRIRATGAATKMSDEQCSRDRTGNEQIFQPVNEE